MNLVALIRDKPQGYWTGRLLGATFYFVTFMIIRQEWNTFSTLWLLLQDSIVVHRLDFADIFVMLKRLFSTLPIVYDRQLLSDRLSRLEGCTFKDIQMLEGSYQIGDKKADKTYHIAFKRLQLSSTDYSLLSIAVPHSSSNFPSDYYGSESNRIALADYLLRLFIKHLDNRKFFAGNPTAKLLERSNIFVSGLATHALVKYVFRTSKEKVCGLEARDDIVNSLHGSIKRTFYNDNVVEAALDKWMRSIENQSEIDKEFQKSGYAAFIKNGSFVLGGDGTREIVAHSENESCLVSGAKELKGIAIQRGITLIVGNEITDRKALLESLSANSNFKAAEDSQEFVFVDNRTVYIRNSEFRPIPPLDMWPFITSDNFKAKRANLTLSIIANIKDAVESGARCLLLDDEILPLSLNWGTDTKMEMLSEDSNHFLFLSWLHLLVKNYNLSIIFATNSFDFVSIADQILCLNNGVLQNITNKTKSVQTKRPPIIDLDYENRVVPFSKLRPLPIRGLLMGIDLKKLIWGIDESQILFSIEALMEFSKEGKDKTLKEIANKVDSMKFDEFPLSSTQFASRARGVDVALIAAFIKL